MTTIATFIASLLCSLLAFAAGYARASIIDEARKEGALVFYGSMMLEHHDKLVKAFTHKYPFVKVEGFRANSMRVVNRSMTEARAGRPLVDVINVDELSGWVLKEKGLLQSYRSVEAEAFPEQYRDPEGLFTCCT